MAFKPNYQQQRSDRQRAKSLKKQDKLRRREDAAAARRETEVSETPETGDTALPSSDQPEGRDHD